MPKERRHENNWCPLLTSGVSQNYETVLTDFILKEGLGGRLADSNHDGTITSKELKSWVDNYSGFERAVDTLKLLGTLKILDEFETPSGEFGGSAVDLPGGFTNIMGDSGNDYFGSYSVPEPPTLLFLGLGLACVFFWHMTGLIRNKRKAYFTV